MGAWGIGNFENDDAGDWVYELEKSQGKSLLHETLSKVCTEEYPEAPDCSEALAAAEVVLAGLTAEVTSLPDEAKVWLGKKSGWLIKKVQRFDAKDAELALSAVRKVLANSELAELWDESDESESWRAAQAAMVRKLESHAQQVR